MNGVRAPMGRARRLSALETQGGLPLVLESLMHTSGGSALLAALASCEHLSVYGSGLFGRSTHLGSDKSYVHYDDPHGVGGCANRSEGRSGAPGAAPPSAEHSKWLRDRVTHEVLLHTLHAMGALTWIT